MILFMLCCNQSEQHEQISVLITNFCLADNSLKFDTDSVKFDNINSLEFDTDSVKFDTEKNRFSWPY